MHTFASDLIASGNKIFKVPRGIYSAVLLHFSGTNPATAKTLSDLGTLTVRVNGSPFQSLTIEICELLGRVFRGAPAFTSSNGGSLEAFALVPLVMPHDLQNGCLVDETMPIEIEWTSDSVSDMAGGNVYATAIPAAAYQGYYLKTVKKGITLTTALQTDIAVESARNVGAVAIKDNQIVEMNLYKDNGGTPIVRLRGNQNLFETLANYQAGTITHSTSLATYIRPEMSTNIGELQKINAGDDYTLDVKGASGTTRDFFFFGYDFDSRALQSSMAHIGSVIAANRDAKQMRNLAREAEALSA